MIRNNSGTLGGSVWAVTDACQVALRGTPQNLHNWRTLIQWRCRRVNLIHCTAHWQSGDVTEERGQRVHVTEARYRGCRAARENKHARGNYGAGRVRKGTAGEEARVGAAWRRRARTTIRSDSASVASEEDGKTLCRCQRKILALRAGAATAPATRQRPACVPRRGGGAIALHVHPPRAPRDRTGPEINYSSV